MRPFPSLGEPPFSARVCPCCSFLGALARRGKSLLGFLIHVRVAAVASCGVRLTHFTLTDRPSPSCGVQVAAQSCGVRVAGSELRGQTYTLHFNQSPFPECSVANRVARESARDRRGVKNGLLIKRAGEFDTRRPGHNGKTVFAAGRACQGKVYCVSLTPLYIV
jgi:hypothetical protein